MMNKKLSKALRDLAAELYRLRDVAQGDGPTDKHLDHAALSLEVLAHIVSGKTVEKAFGAPGDWGYGTPIGDGVFAMLKEPLETVACPFCGELEWHYLPELPDPETTVLIATDDPGTDELVLGCYDAEHDDWREDSSILIDKPVYAWAYAPAKPAKKGGA